MGMKKFRGKVFDLMIFYLIGRCRRGVY